jgi:hypothetical protein
MVRLLIHELTIALEAVISNLRSFGILQPRITTLNTILRENYIQPLLTGQHILNVHTSLSISQKSETQPPEKIFKYLASLVTFLSTSFPHSVLQPLIPELLPSLTTDLLMDFLPSHIPLFITELETFDVLLDSVTQFDTHLVNLGWASETPLSLWVSQAPRVWFTNRQALFLSETREFITENKDGKIIVISSGIDITIEPRIHEKSGDSEMDAKVAVKVEKARDDEEEETDGWGFDAEGDESEEVNDVNEEDNWKWEDDLPEEAQVEESEKPQNSENFPYSLSNIPDGLLEIVQRVLDEAAQLQFSEYDSLSLI